MMWRNLITRFSKVAILVALSSQLPGLALAQSVPNAGALQNQLDLQIQRENQPKFTQPPQPQAVPEKKEGEQFFLKGFRFEGNTLFSSEQLNEVVKPYIGKSVYLSELKEATTALQNFYFSKGRIAQAFLPPQEVKDGIVLINIIEGKMGSVIIESENVAEGQSPRFSLERAQTYFIYESAGKVYIDTAPIERSMMLLNEVPGVFASGAFEAGSEPGFSNFRVKVSDTPWFSGQAALSNYGSASTGAYQAIANLNLNNVSGIGDQIGINAIQSLGSGYVVANYSAPVSSNGWNAGVQGSYLQYTTVPNWTSAQTAGSATTVQANTSYALERSQIANTNIKASIENRSYNNVQTNPVMTLSSYQITAMNVTMSGDWATSVDSRLNYSGGLTFGHLGIRDLSQSQADQNGAGTAGAYSKLSFNVAHSLELETLPNTTWTNSVYGQLANKNLNSSEQIYMGGAYGVRAYPTAQGGGSQGAILSTEIDHRLDENWHVGAFADLGLVQQYVNLYSGWKGLTNANNNYQLGDAGLSAKYFYGAALVSASLAVRIGNNPLYNSSGQQLNVDNAYKSYQAWIRASLPF